MSTLRPPPALLRRQRRPSAFHPGNRKSTLPLPAPGFRTREIVLKPQPIRKRWRHLRKPDFVPRRSPGGSTVIPLTRTSRPAFPASRPGATNPGLSWRLAPPGSDRLPVFPVCLAPRRVFRAPGLAARGGGLLPRLFTLASKPLRAGRRFIFCDTVRQRGLSPPTARVHHAARCLVVSGLSSRTRSEKQTPATVSGAANPAFPQLHPPRNRNPPKLPSLPHFPASVPATRQTHSPTTRHTGITPPPH